MNDGVLSISVSQCQFIVQKPNVIMTLPTTFLLWTVIYTCSSLSSQWAFGHCPLFICQQITKENIPEISVKNTVISGCILYRHGL